MKRIKLFVVSLVLALGCVGLSYAADTENEPASPDGSFGLSEIGAWYNSTTTATSGRQAYTRRVQTTNDGILKMSYVLQKSTFIAAYSSTFTMVRDVIDGSTGASINGNVFALGSQFKPVRGGHLVFGGVVPGSVADGTLVRIFDSRGSTSTDVSALRYQIITSSFMPPYIPINLEFVSGFEVQVTTAPGKGGILPIPVTLTWSEPTR